MTLRTRLSLVLCGIAVLSTVLALIPQERALPRELESAAQDRLQRAAAAADLILESHLESFGERYRSVSHTPELRANLESRHAPTLEYFMRRLGDEQGAAILAFLDRGSRVVARTGSAELLRAVLRGAGREEGVEGEPFVVHHAGETYTVVALPLRTGEERVGRLVAAEPIDEDIVARWSQLCGADVAFAGVEDPANRELAAPARRFGDFELRVSGSLDAERGALASARRDLLTGGAVALAFAFGVSLFLARGLIRPIRMIQDATEPIGRGRLDVRLPAGRRDEIGDVSRAFNLMLERLQGTLGALRTSEARLFNAQRLARLGGWSIELPGGEMRASEEFRRIFGMSSETPPSREWLLSRIHGADRERFRTALDRCLHDGTPFRLDHRIVAPGGTERFVHSQGQRVEESEGRARFEGTAQDISERKLIEEQVRYLASHDSLTGLGNRHLFVEGLTLSIQEARRGRTVLGVVILGLDGFKLINDTLGHSAGDRLLGQVAARLVECAVGEEGGGRTEPLPAAQVARLGGDEFALLLPPGEGPQALGRLARRILERLSEPVDLSGQEVVVGGSIGIAIWPADGEDAETLLRNCDTALNHAKEQGRNGYQFYSEAMNMVVLKKLLLENSLRRAVEGERLELRFQPKVELATRRVSGVEALVRWRDPELGIVPPSEFIPLAEEAGFIGAIGEWVMRASVRQLAQWRDTELGDLRLAINFSGHEFGPALVDRLEEVLRAHDVDPSLLDLEVTETAVMKRDPSLIQALERLRALGIRISLDDFGTGYSSLSHLRTLPIDTLKIDRSFIEHIETSADDAALLGSILSMARVLRLRVVAEGVETDRQLHLLAELGCGEIQGHLLSAAVRAGDLVRVRREIEGHTLGKRRSRRRRTRGGSG